MNSIPTSSTAAQPPGTMVDPHIFLSPRPDRIPRLLVSVRTVTEAQQAIVGGAEILDVKEPSRGSLGMASIDEIHAIAQLNLVSQNPIPLSVALSELTDWLCQLNLPPLPTGVSFAKLGLSHCVERPDWVSNWVRIREEFDRTSKSKLNWVAVAYADADEAASPSVSSVMEAAIKTHCAGLLIDTWSKGHMTLLDRLNPAQLNEIAEECHASGLFFAIAGKLQFESLPELSGISADVIAIRSAACLAADRTSELDRGRVAVFRDELRRVFASR